MFNRLKQFLSGQRPPEEREAREREIMYLCHKINNSIQVVQSGQRILNNMSGVIELNKRGKSR